MFFLGDPFQIPFSLFFNINMRFYMSEYIQNLILDSSTIAAISTGLTESGIGIIRVSGRDAIKSTSYFISDLNLENVSANTINYCHFSYKNEIIDEVMVSVFKGPKSYTREDVVEINCHGSSFVMEEILSALLTNDIRIAEPGEFTKRAFLNGRIDLSQSEAVMDIIRSKNDFSRKAALGHLRGNLSEKIHIYRNEILHECAFIESALDDPEHYSLDGYSNILNGKVTEIINSLKILVSTFNEGSVLSHGIDTAIVGKPNVGKSSLLNLLCGEDFAIVTDIPGTTRDTIRQTVNFNGIPLNLIDTAGIRFTDDKVEKIGVERSLSLINKADLIIFIIDSSRSMTSEDYKIIDILGDSNVITLCNKADIKDKKVDISSIPEKLKENLIYFSTVDKVGMDDLSKCIKRIFLSGSVIDPGDVLLSNRRQLSEINNAINSLLNVINTIDCGMSEDLYTIDLMDAYASLGRITGESVEDDLVEKIFSDFCMGK